ncbi:MAG: ABC transporter permease [Nitriliruptoraceae bacterium]
MGLLAAELRKLTTVRTTWVITLLGAVFAAFGAGFFLFETELSGPFTGADGQIAAAIENVGSMSPVVVVVGLLAMTTEFRHGTAGRTFQLTPSRTRVMLAKLVIGALYGVAFAVFGTVLVAVVVAVAALGIDDALDIGPDTVAAVWQAPVGLGLATVLGVSIGALLRNQVVAVTVTLVYLFLGEQLFNQFFPELARWLPFQALQALYTSEETLAAMPEGMIQPLDAPVALAVFLAYVAVATIGATILLRYRDI